MVGAYALTVDGSVPINTITDEAIIEDGEEAREKVNLSIWYTAQLSKQRQAIWVPDWEDAKTVLEKIDWLQRPGAHGELVLKTTLEASC